MSDELFLSLWYPNFSTPSLGPALLGVMRQFTLTGVAAGDSPRVRAAAVYPISWNEAPVYQRIYEPDEREAAPELAVPAALETLHEDFAYEFEMDWELWAPGTEPGLGLDPIWTRQPHRVRVVGYGPEFDERAYEQNGQIRVDLGLDTPFLQEEVELDNEAAAHIRENVKMLVEFTNAVQKNCGISSRLLWSESGESLAQKLVARLQQVN